MNKYYDKLLLLVALLVLAGGISYSLGLGKKNISIENQITEAHLKGEPFAPLAPPAIEASVRAWNEPIAQDEKGEWLYGVFTPPKIYLNPKTGELLPRGIIDGPAIPFGLELLTMSHVIYPIQFEAYFESVTGDPKDSTVMFFHTQRNESSGIMKMGSVHKEWGITVSNLSVEKINREDGTIETVSKVTVQDDNYNREFVFTPGEVVELEDQNVFTLKATGALGEEFIWKKEGDTFEKDGATYTLMQIDFDKKTLTVKKESESLEEPEEQTLIPQGNISTKLEEPQQPTEKPKEEDTFDAIFIN